MKYCLHYSKLEFEDILLHFIYNCNNQRMQRQMKCVLFLVFISVVESCVVHTTGSPKSQDCAVEASNSSDWFCTGHDFVRVIVTKVDEVSKTVSAKVLDIKGEKFNIKEKPQIEFKVDFGGANQTLSEYKVGKQIIMKIYSQEPGIIFNTKNCSNLLSTREEYHKIKFHWAARKCGCDDNMTTKKCYKTEIEKHKKRQENKPKKPEML